MKASEVAKETLREVMRHNLALPRWTWEDTVTQKMYEGLSFVLVEGRSTKEFVRTVLKELRKWSFRHAGNGVWHCLVKAAHRLPDDYETWLYCYRLVPE